MVPCQLIDGIGRCCASDTETTGNYQKTTWFDGRWQPLLTREEDTGNAASLRYVRRTFDSDSRETFEQRIADYDREFAGGDVPRPPHWSGFRLVPRRIEFWQDREYRLHRVP